MSRRNLYSILRSLNNDNKDVGGLRRLAGQVTLPEKVKYLKMEHNALDWHLMEMKVVRRDMFFSVLTKTPTKAKNTLRITKSMSIADIGREMDLKLFEHQHAQVIHAQNPKLGNGGAKNKRQRDLKSPPKREYPVLPESNMLEPLVKMHQAPMPYKATSARMGVSRSTLIRRVHNWNERGDVLKTKRRIRLSSAPENIESFHEEYGAFPFQVGGLWYAQLSNVYEILRDYRGISKTLVNAT